MFVELSESLFRNDVEWQVFNVKMIQIGSSREQQSVLVYVQQKAFGRNDSGQLNFDDEKLGISLRRIFENDEFRFGGG